MTSLGRQVQFSAPALRSLNCRPQVRQKSPVALISDVDGSDAPVEAPQMHTVSLAQLLSTIGNLRDRPDIAKQGLWRAS
jgi:hypothetical protein